MDHRTCMAPECTKAPRTPNGDLCEMHYMRMYRHGNLDGLRPRRTSRGICVVDGCEKPDAGHDQLCTMHHTRISRHGSPDTVLAPRVYRGPDSTSWLGDAIGYRTAHDRVFRTRGSAKGYACVGCGSQALHWSYDHRDPDERRSNHPKTLGLPYSTKPEHYQPRCVPCHKAFDLARPKT